MRAWYRVAGVVNRSPRDDRTAVAEEDLDGRRVASRRLSTQIGYVGNQAHGRRSGCVEDRAADGEGAPLVHPDFDVTHPLAFDANWLRFSLVDGIGITGAYFPGFRPENRYRPSVSVTSSIRERSADTRLTTRVVRAHDRQQLALMVKMMAFQRTPDDKGRAANSNTSAPSTLVTSYRRPPTPN